MKDEQKHGQEQEDVVRVLRLVEYEGPRSLVEQQIVRSLHGTRDGMGTFGRKVRITAVTLGIYPEVIEEARRVAAPEVVQQLEQVQRELQTAKAKIAEFIYDESHGEDKV